MVKDREDIVDWEGMLSKSQKKGRERSITGLD